MKRIHARAVSLLPLRGSAQRHSIVKKVEAARRRIENDAVLIDPHVEMRFGAGRESVLCMSAKRALCDRTLPMYALKHGQSPVECKAIRSTDRAGAGAPVYNHRN